MTQRKKSLYLIISNIRRLKEKCIGHKFFFPFFSAFDLNLIRSVKYVVSYIQNERRNAGLHVNGAGLSDFNQAGNLSESFSKTFEDRANSCIGSRLRVRTDMAKVIGAAVQLSLQTCEKREEHSDSN
jgi:hypothetical protein